ncbi:hypothetical protein [Parerythrobacter lacustris]|uniref:YfhD family protein n=1 Tax=Parerythrobacter lacustris TaxID=2969984 RepID=A0ABT1XMZ2_9SPHN|nr:hypothetical protein [Parerythrobacter lacustris]MCR2833013.1 hypothetical protein [Parerythrobacter lacustris]
MGKITTKSDAKSQSEEFKKLARELECDEDEARWDERLKKVAKPHDKRESS